MIHLIHPTGNTFVRALLAALQTTSAEYTFYTTIATGSSKLMNLLPPRLQKQLERRFFDIPRSRLVTRGRYEWTRLIASQSGLPWLTRHETGWASVDAIYKDLDRHVARKIGSMNEGRSPASWVYGYEDGCFESFKAAKRIGMRRAYELPIAYWETSRRLLEEEAQRLPHWADTLVGPADSEAKLERKTCELACANVVIVPSQFVANSLTGAMRDDQKVVIAKFGSPVIGEAESGKRKADRGSRLRVLFAGSLSQRKGLADVFEAVRMLNRSDVELVVMGSLVAPLSFYRAQGVPFTYEQPRPHDKVLALMRTCDVLVLPSIVEGRALVQQEALSCGLPLIVTANAGGDDLVIEGKTGFLVPIRLPEVVAAKIDWLADHRSCLEAMREACREQAASCTWERYGARILEALQAHQVSMS